MRQNLTSCQLVTEHEAASFLCLRVKTLQRWRWQKRGPNWYKIGGAVRYRLSELAEFLKSSHRRSTGENTGEWAR